MRPGTKTYATLAAIGQQTTYAQLHEATGYGTKLLTNIVAGLKRRGMIERANPHCSNHVPAVLRITAKGLAELTPLAGLPDPGETLVGRALRARPALATVWVDEGCYFMEQGALAREAAEAGA